VGGVEIASFQEASIASAEYDVAQWTAAGAVSTPLRAVPTLKKLPQVTLKRRLDGNTAIWTWHESVRTDITKAARSASLIVYDAGRNVVARYGLERALPVRIDIDSGKLGEAPAETVVLVCERLRRE
jgi:phage tail-like protein